MAVTVRDVVIRVRVENVGTSGFGTSSLAGPGQGQAGRTRTSPSGGTGQAQRLAAERRLALSANAVTASFVGLERTARAATAALALFAARAGRSAGRGGRRRSNADDLAGAGALRGLLGRIPPGALPAAGFAAIAIGGPLAIAANTLNRQQFRSIRQRFGNLDPFQGIDVPGAINERFGGPLSFREGQSILPQFQERVAFRQRQANVRQARTQLRFENAVSLQQARLARAQGISRQQGITQFDVEIAVQRTLLSGARGQERVNRLENIAGLTGARTDEIRRLGDEQVRNEREKTQELRTQLSLERQKAETLRESALGRAQRLFLQPPGQTAAQLRAVEQAEAGGILRSPVFRQRLLGGLGVIPSERARPIEDQLIEAVAQDPLQGALFGTTAGLQQQKERISELEREVETRQQTEQTAVVTASKNVRDAFNLFIQALQAANVGREKQFEATKAKEATRAPQGI